MKVREVSPDHHESSVIWFREDGRKMYLMRSFDGFADSISTVRITSQTDHHDLLKSAMLSFLWMWNPRGQPLYKYLDSGCQLKFAPHEDGKPDGRVLVDAESDGIPLRFELDPTHDYLPLTITIFDPQTKAEWELQRATRFAKVEGVWFPVEGTEVAIGHGRDPTPKDFRVQEIHINRPIPDAEFVLPDLEKGVLVSDFSGGPDYFKGSDKDRDRLEAKYGTQEQVIASGPMNAAAVVPDRGIWGPLLVIGSSLTLVVAFFAWRRQRRGIV